MASAAAAIDSMVIESGMPVTQTVKGEGEGTVYVLWQLGACVAGQATPSISLTTLQKSASLPMVQLNTVLLDFSARQADFMEM